MLACPMRRTGLFVLLVVVLGALAAMQWLGMFAGDDIAIPMDGSPTTATPAPAPAVRPDPTTGATATPLGDGLQATRTQVALPPNPNLADAPTAWLRVVDHASDQPIAGVPLRTVQTGREIAFTDERGLAGIPLREPEQLAAVVDGYLLRLVPTRLHSTETEPQVVRMVLDQWSIVREVRFTTPNGARVTEAFVRFRPLGNGKQKPTPAPIPAEDAVLQRAWEEHLLLAQRPVCADVPVQLGTWSEDRVHRLTDGAAVRFLAPGAFTLEAATTSGLAAKVDVRVDAAPRTNAPAVRVAMAAGAFLTGTVVDASGTPLADTRLVQQGSDPLGLVATTSANGTFRFGPLPAGPLTLHVHHGEHQPLAFGPITVPGEAVRIALQPLSRSALRGRVRSHPNHRPLAGATVVWTPPTGTPVTVKTNAEGQFVLPATGNVDARLTILAVGHVERVEMVTPGAAFADYDVWPAAAMERVAAGLSTIFAGSVLDAEGRPVAGAFVRWTPAQPTAAATGLANAGAVPGRRVLSGATLELPATVSTGSDGGFVLETTQFGPGRLHLFGNDAIAVTLVAIAGVTRNDIRLKP